MLETRPGNKTQPLRIVVGADRRGASMVDQLLNLLARLEYRGVELKSGEARAVEFPDIAARVAREVSRQEAYRGLLIGRTGIGMCIVANKFPGVRAANCYDELTAEMCRRHLDVNVLCVSAELLSPGVLQRMIRVWLDAPFDGGRHLKRLRLITALERALLAPASEPGVADAGMLRS